jgi:hypothetical protein
VFPAAQCSIRRVSQLMKLLEAKLSVMCVDTHVCVSCDLRYVGKGQSFVYETRILVFIRKKCVTFMKLIYWARKN